MLSQAQSSCITNGSCQSVCRSVIAPPSNGVAAVESAAVAEEAVQLAVLQVLVLGPQRRSAKEVEEELEGGSRPAGILPRPLPRPCIRFSKRTIDYRGRAGDPHADLVHEGARGGCRGRPRRAADLVHGLQESPGGGEP